LGFFSAQNVFLTFITFGQPV